MRGLGCVEGGWGRGYGGVGGGGGGPFPVLLFVYSHDRNIHARPASQCFDPVHSVIALHFFFFFFFFFLSLYWRGLKSNCKTNKMVCGLVKH